MSESSGSVFLEGSNRRRWLISAAIVLLVHACIAAAVLTWRHVSSAPPLLVDLAPSPPASEQRGTPPGPPAAAQTSSQQSAPEQKTASVSASASIGRDQPRPAPPAASTGAQLSALPQDAIPKNGTEPEVGAAGATITGGEASRKGPGGPGSRAAATQAANHASEINSAVLGPVASNPASAGLTPKSPARNSPMANMPLDTSITVQPPVHGNGIDSFSHGEIGPLASREPGPDAAPFDQRPTSIFRPAKPFGVPDVPRNSLLPNGGTVWPSNSLSPPGLGRTNVPGAHVQDRARAAIMRAMSQSESVKNAIGSAVGSSVIANNARRGDNDLPNGAVYGVGRSMMNVASRGDLSNLNNGIVRNSVGVTANFRPLIPRASAGEAKSGVIAAANHEMPTAPVINGRNIERPVANSGVIGGPARRAGILSGSDFGRRHP